MGSVGRLKSGSWQYSQSKIALFYVGSNSIGELKILSTSHLALGSYNMIGKKSVLKKQLHRIITICQIFSAQAFKETNDSKNIDMLIQIHPRCNDTATKPEDYAESRFYWRMSFL